MRLAKLTQPKSINTIARPRLFRLLDKAARKPVTWIWAPPGAGKTTLISSYLAAKKLRTLWFQIDAADNDLATFFYYLGIAAPKRKQAMPLFTPDYHLGLPIFSRNFFRELFVRWKPPFVVVLDNYQEIASDSPLHEALQYGLAEITPQSRAIFISRSVPPGQFAALRAKQGLEIVEWDDVRFTRSEVDKLVKRLATDKWPKTAIDQLYERADGWVAGLVLLMEQRKDRSANFTTRGESPQIVFDYFAGEIFNRAGNQTKEVLLQTAFLPRVTARMAEELTGIETSGEVLARLHRQNYFTNRRAAEEPTYEYHPLFREFLLLQAKKYYSSNQLAEICRKAVAIIEPTGRIEAAAALLRAAGDYERLAGLICRHAAALLAQGRRQTLEEWLSDVPPQLFEINPWLFYWRGMCRFTWRHAECDSDLEQAFMGFRQHRDSAGIFSAWSALIMSYQSEGTTTLIDQWIVLFDELMQEVSDFPSQDVETRVAAAMLSAIVSRDPGHRDGARWADRALELTRQHPDLSLRAITAVVWFYYHYRRGDCAKAAVVVNDMQALLHAPDVSPIVKLDASMAVVFYEFAYAVPSYRRTVAEVLNLTRATGILRASKGVCLGIGIRAALSDGDWETANIWIREMEKDLDTIGVGQRAWYFIFVVRSALLSGDLEHAAAQQPEMLRLSLASGAPLTLVEAHLISAEVLGLCGQLNDAQFQIQQTLKLAEQACSLYFEFMARLTDAHICFVNHRDPDAIHALRRGMEIGRERGLVNSFVWHPPVMAHLCAKALEAGIEVEYVQSLVRKRRLVPENPPIDVEAWPWPVKIFTLGKFEVFVDGEPLAKRRKAPHRLLDFLKALVAFGAINVPSTKLMDALWPDTEGDTAKENLDKTLQRLRRLLGQDQILPVKGARVSLNPAICWTDAQAFERLATSNADGSNYESLSRAIQLYQGPFLADQGDESWIDVTRERLRRKYRQTVFALAEAQERERQPDRAVEYLQQAVSVDPLDEPIVCRLIALLVQNHRRAEALAVFQKYRKELAEFGVEASFRVDNLIQSVNLDG